MSCHSESDRESVFPRIRPAHENAGQRIADDALKSAPLVDTKLHPLSHAVQGEDDVPTPGDGGLQEDAILRVAEASRFSGVLYVHPEIDDVGEDLNMPGRLH